MMKILEHNPCQIKLFTEARVKFGDTLKGTLEGNTFNDFNYLLWDT